MHFELKQFLYDALGRFVERPAASSMTEAVREAVRSLLLAKRDETFAAQALLIEVVDTPEKIRSVDSFANVLTSNLAFHVAKNIPPSSQLSPEESSPYRVAQVLLEEFTRAENNLFRIELGGPGHLNVSLTDSFQDRFTRRLLEGGVSQLFREQSFVVLKSQNQVGDGLIIPRFRTSWPKLLGRAASTKDEDTRLLVAAAEEREVDWRGEEIDNWDWQIMLLALLGDPELSVRPFLENLRGRENLPWYVRKFFSDARAFVGNRDGDIREGTSVLATLETISSQRSILSARQVFLDSHRRDRPEIFVRHLMESIQSFYLFYNRPEVRALRLDPLKSNQLLAYQRLAMLIHDLVAIGLSTVWPSNVFNQLDPAQPASHS